MRKIAVILFISLFLAGCRTNSSDISSDQSGDENQIIVDIVEEAADNIEKKYNQGYSLDKHYIEEFREAENYSDMSSITDRYAQMWLEKVNEYYSVLSEDVAKEYEDNDLAKDYIQRHNLDLGVIIKSQEQWAEYAEKQIENRRMLAELRYMGGTASASAIAQYKYDIYRARAIELYEECLLWGIELSEL